MLNDKEILEKRLDIFSMEAWSLFIEELNDMAKSLERGMVISQVRLVSKEGGKSGTWSTE